MEHIAYFQSYVAPITINQVESTETASEKVPKAKYLPDFQSNSLVMVVPGSEYAGVVHNSSCDMLSSTNRHGISWVINKLETNEIIKKKRRWYQNNHIRLNFMEVGSLHHLPYHRGTEKSVKGHIPPSFLSQPKVPLFLLLGLAQSLHKSQIVNYWMSFIIEYDIC